MSLRPAGSPRRLALFLAAWAGAFLALNAPSPALAKTYVGDCGHTGYLSYKEDRWSAGCTGGSFNVNSIRWARWTDRAARGAGEVRLRDPECRPTCPEARVFRYTARISFSHPRTCRNDAGNSHRYFSRVAVRVKWKAGNPFDEPAGWRTENFPVADGGCLLPGERDFS